MEEKRGKKKKKGGKAEERKGQVKVLVSGRQWLLGEAYYAELVPEQPDTRRTKNVRPADENTRMSC